MYGVRDGEPILDDFVCTGNEASLFDCQYTTTHNCDHSEDMGLRCGEMIIIVQWDMG